MVKRGKVHVCGGTDLQLCYLDRWWTELVKATIFKNNYNQAIIKHHGKLRCRSPEAVVPLHRSLGAFVPPQSHIRDALTTENISESYAIWKCTRTLLEQRGRSRKLENRSNR